jgi:hypothetical protein
MRYAAVYQALVLVLFGIILYAFLNARREDCGEIPRAADNPADCSRRLSHCPARRRSPRAHSATTFSPRADGHLPAPFVPDGPGHDRYPSGRHARAEYGPQGT